MSDENRCSSCFVPDLKPPQSPCPQLLLSNIPPPDFQIHEIKSAIASVEDDISGLDVQIAGLRRSLDQLTSQRAELERFANDHRGVISIVRRLPSDILAEIFSRCVDFSETSGPQTGPMLVQVSGRWRAHALDLPQLWSYFYIPPEEIHDEFYKRQIPLQLQRSRQTPLYISMYTPYGDVTLNLLLTASARWKDVELSFSSALYRQFFASACNFTTLKKLVLLSWDQLEWPVDGVRHLFERLPALNELQLDTYKPFSHLPFPWSQLRRCTLKQCRPEDLLQVLPLLSPGAHLFGRQSTLRPVRLFTENIRSPIHGLELDGSMRFMTTVFSSLTAPALKELRVTTYKEFPDTPASPTIISFLSRSACMLTSLCLALPLPDEDFIGILDSPHTRSVVHLDISNKMSTQLVEALTSRGLVPNLRALGFRADPTLPEAPVLTMVASRRPVLRELRIASLKLHPVLSQAAVQALGANGMEVFLSEYNELRDTY
ncbi:hypothetical protein DFH06DRAFT_503569 [Mycena polygramma]|nr:hypothetical protein DFH06DRAFT_503569 [Mycena polygramma]